MLMAESGLLAIWSPTNSHLLQMVSLHEGH